MKRLLLLLALLGSALAAEAALAPARAEAQYYPTPDVARRHTYEMLRRDPWKAVGWDLLLPGAGSAYVGLWGNTAVSAVLTLAGAALWIHGGVKDNDTTYITGASLFAVGRAYGVVSAGVGAYMLNRALKRQLSIGVAPTGLRLRF